MTGSGAHGGQGSGGRTFSRWAVLLTVLVMTFMGCLDSSIVTVALPVMQKELGVGIDQIQWVSSVYLISTCVGVLPFGRLGDLRGKVYVFQAGVVIFTVGSLLCGLAPTLPMLIVGRIVQGIGCAAAMANNMGIITEAFPQRELGRAMGLLATFVSLGMMAGPVLGGIIVSTYAWEGIFLINVPVGIVSFVVGLRTLPHVRPSTDAAARAYSMLGSARLCFSNPTFAINLLSMLIVFMGIGSYEFVLPFYFQDAHGLSAGVSSLARYAGMAVGISSASAMLYGRMGQAAGHAVTGYVDGRPDVFLAVFSFVFYVLAAVAAVGLVLTLVRLVLSRREG